MACLNQRLHELGTLVKLLEQPNPALISRAADAASGLSPIENCAQTESLPLPPNGKSDDLEALGLRLASARVHILLGTYEAGAEQAQQLVAEARELGYRPVIADTLLLPSTAANGALPA